MYCLSLHGELDVRGLLVQVCVKPEELFLNVLPDDSCQMMLVNLANLS